MSDNSLIALSYASTATFEATRGSFGVHPQVNRILMQSRRNNRRDAIGGMLHFGEGRFFQYLEGDADAVDRVYARIRGDDRHRDVRQIERRPIEQRQFEDWSMKFVVLEQVVDAVLSRRGLDRFDPYAFTPAIVDDLIKATLAAPEAASAAAAAVAPEPRQRGLGGWWRRLIGRG